jgi:hypothetical protein
MKTGINSDSPSLADIQFDRAARWIKNQGPHTEGKPPSHIREKVRRQYGHLVAAFKDKPGLLQIVRLSQ